MMPLKLIYDSSSPIYVQLYEQIRYFIINGILKAGIKLPSVDQLAKCLRIDRSTVVRVYRKLEFEGYVVSKPGLGTFVKGNHSKSEWAEAESMFKIADEAFRTVVENQLDPERFAHIVAARCAWWKGRVQEPVYVSRIGFVECELENLNVYSQELSRALNIQVEPILLSDIREGKDTVRDSLSGISIVVTTFFHLSEVRRLLPGKRVIGILASPTLIFISTIAQLPRGISLGVICKTARDSDFIIRWVKNIRPDVQIQSGSVKNPQTIAKALECSTCLILSAISRKGSVSISDDKGHTLLSRVTIVDDEAVAMLRELIRRELAGIAETAFDYRGGS